MSKGFLKDIKMHHAALRVSDWERSIKFYVDGMGFKNTIEWNRSTDGKRMAMLELDAGGVIEMFEGGTGKLPENHEEISGSYFQYCFLVKRNEDVDALYEYAISIGASPKIPPKDYDMIGKGEAHSRACFVYGPDGEVLEFLKIPRDA